MINISNPTSKNNSSWRLGAPAGLDEPTPRSEPGPGVHALSALGLAIRVLISWLAAIPARLGDRLFRSNDTEAYWHDWQITKTQGGLGRSYRDPRFGLLAECPRCHGTGSRTGGSADRPCPPCQDTGRITMAAEV